MSRRSVSSSRHVSERFAATQGRRRRPLVTGSTVPNGEVFVKCRNERRENLASRRRCRMAWSSRADVVCTARNVAYAPGSAVLSSRVLNVAQVTVAMFPLRTLVDITAAASRIHSPAEAW